MKFLKLSEVFNAKRLEKEAVVIPEDEYRDLLFSIVSRVNELVLVNSFQVENIILNEFGIDKEPTKS